MNRIGGHFLSYVYIWLTKKTVHEMLKFAQDLRTCRKVAFAKVGRPAFQN